MSNKPNFDIKYAAKSEIGQLERIVTNVVGIIVFPLPLWTLLSLGLMQ